MENSQCNLKATWFISPRTNRNANVFS